MFVEFKIRCPECKSESAVTEQYTPKKFFRVYSCQTCKAVLPIEFKMEIGVDYEVKRMIPGRPEVTTGKMVYSG